MWLSSYLIYIMTF